MRPMSDESQIEVPRSFIELFIPEGRIKPTASREAIAARYEFCEDLANALTERAGTLLWQLHITEQDVLDRMGQGLLGAESGVSPEEAGWILTRLAELLGWPLPSTRETR